MAILQGKNVRIEMQSTLGSDLTVTGVTKASPGVATSTAHGLANGDVVVFKSVSGMTELDGQAVRVANVAANTFELEGLDTTNFGTFVSGTANEVTAWTTIGQVQSIEAEQANPNRIDVTTLADNEKQYVFGLADTANITLNALYDPSLASHIAIKAASDANAARTFRFTFGTPKVIGNFYVTGGDGFSMAQNDVAKTRYGLSSIKRRMNYAS
jgi:hypothetical protein